MNKTKIGLGMGIVLAVLALLTASATADTYFYLVPQNSSCGPSESVLVSVVIHTDRNDIGSAQAHIDFDPTVVNITNMVEPTDKNDWDMWDWLHKGNYVFVHANEFGGFGPGEIYLGNMTLKCINPGVSPVEFTHPYPQTPDPTAIGDTLGEFVSNSGINGTFTCTAPQETYSKDLVEGWNLISLPLTADDMMVSSVFSSVAGKYDALYRYDAETHSWVALGDDDTLENGVGYFINMTESGTWTYQGSAYTTMSISLEPGLNMVGWLNCSKPIDDALSSIEGNYRYVARWNSTAHKFEVYVPGAPSGFNDFNTMERGEGYFISMKTSDTLTASC